MQHIVKNEWIRAEGLDIEEKISRCGVKLQEWGGGINKNLKQQLQDCKWRLRRLRSRRDTQGV